VVKAPTKKVARAPMQLVNNIPSVARNGICLGNDKVFYTDGAATVFVTQSYGRGELGSMVTMGPADNPVKPVFEHFSGVTACAYDGQSTLFVADTTGLYSLP